MSDVQALDENQQIPYDHFYLSQTEEHYLAWMLIDPLDDLYNGPILTLGPNSPELLQKNLANVICL
ncbi:2057_t:CDS:2 [Acaulospora colombiana]|uniref:2057_t:CDS:1 n=1 Tax=Acaulospora colombiana TaxID=27376 RepID=A0ACA9LCL1_9GLOM|nr:2057_t:CDS:2 [Acaulospora colombiana]